MNNIFKNLLIILVIVLAVFAGWYFFSNDKDTHIRFSEEGNLIKNNPGLVPDVWYISYDQPGAPGLVAEILLNNDSTCIKDDLVVTCSLNELSEGMRVKVEGYIENNKVAVQVLSSESPKETGMNISLYYYNPALDQGPGGVQCTEKGLVEVKRIIPETAMPLTETIKLLLRGEISAEEKSKGVTSEFPLSGVTLEKAVVSDGVATLTFNDPQNKTGGGSCRVAILWRQIEATAKQFNTVTSVRFMPEELFQP